MPPELPTRPEVPRIPPGFFAPTFWFILVADLALVALNTHLAFINAREPGAHDWLLAINCGGIAISGCGTYTFITSSVRHWREWQRLRAELIEAYAKLKRDLEDRK